MDHKEEKMKKKSGKKKSLLYLPKLGCLKIEEDKEGNFDIEVENIGGDKPNPTHLVIMVNGIIGSAQNWKFAAKQLLKKYPRDVVVHCSQANSLLLTFDGVDVMGERLAEEVISVVKRHPSVRKISFVGHSLGGLVSRYAIAKLYELDISQELDRENGEHKSNGSTEASDGKVLNRIAGLEPINFITFATPHLGSRGHKQVPMFCGSYKMEKAAARISWCLGRTGKHLFLTDGKNGAAPLLLQMVSDTENLKFISALQSFKRRVAYANAHFDNLVGWSTSSLRRRNDLPKRRHLSRNDAYRHIVKVLKKSEDDSPETEVPTELKVNGCKADDKEINGHQQEVPADSKIDYGKEIDMEEEMLRRLTKLSWERIDVKFNGFSQRFLAHNSIQVKGTCLYSAGADVVQHMIDESFLL